MKSEDHERLASESKQPRGDRYYLPTWCLCGYCGKEFQLSHTQRKKITARTKHFKHYCSPECLNAGRNKRSYPENQISKTNNLIPTENGLQKDKAINLDQVNLSSEIIDFIVDTYQQGYGITTIARAIKFHSRGIKRILECFEIEIRTAAGYAHLGGDNRKHPKELEIPYGIQCLLIEQSQKINWLRPKEIINDGYVSVFAPKGHPRHNDGRIPKHLFVMEQKLGRYIGKDSTEQIHHINLVKLDNHKDNLELAKDPKEHSKWHNTISPLFSEMVTRKIANFKKQDGYSFKEGFLNWYDEQGEKHFEAWQAQLN